VILWDIRKGDSVSLLGTDLNNVCGDFTDKAHNDIKIIYAEIVNPFFIVADVQYNTGIDWNRSN